MANDDIIGSLYLSEDGADVWFEFENDRIPGHKFILTRRSPWLETMFNGSLAEGKIVDMNDMPVSAEAFKEFLRFIYRKEVQLATNNIDEAMYLAKLSLSDEFFDACEQFLINSVTIDNIFSVYQLAKKYESKKLKEICDYMIGKDAEKVIKSPSFLQFEYENLLEFVQCDFLLCEEKDIFDACIAWAKAACVRNNQDPLIPANLRAHLKDSIYQIRFTAMSKEEVGACIISCRGLFTAEELEEILIMVGRTEMVISKFESHLRVRLYSSSKISKVFYSTRTKLLWDYIIPYGALEFSPYQFQREEKTIFTFNQRAILKGFLCECASRAVEQVTVTITETKYPNNRKERYKQRQILDFSHQRDYTLLSSYTAPIELGTDILLLPNCQYEIKIQFQSEPQLRSLSTFAPESRPSRGFDPKITYQNRGIVSSLGLVCFEAKSLQSRVKKFLKSLFFILMTLELSNILSKYTDGTYKYSEARIILPLFYIIVFISNRVLVFVMILTLISYCMYHSVNPFIIINRVRSWPRHLQFKVYAYFLVPGVVLFMFERNAQMEIDKLFST